MRAAHGVSMKSLTVLPEGDPGSFQYSTVQYGTVPRRQTEIEENILKLGVLKYFARPGRASSIRSLDSSLKSPIQLN